MQATNVGGGGGHDDGSRVRLLKIPRAAPQIEEYGFRLTRSKWDPYPWVSEVAAGTPASLCGLKTGDCILKVNGVDIVGMRIADVAQIVKSQKDAVTFLCWNSDCETDCDENSICCVPMPTSLKRLGVIVESILRVIECPVCNVTITPPVMQCQNGHLLCLDCRIRSEKCPMCRGFFTPIRSGVAEEIYSIIAGAFEHCQRDGKLRHQIFGEMSLIKTKPNSEDCICRESLKQRKSLLPKNKILSKLLQAKAGSLENLFQCNAAKLLRAEATESFNVMPLEEGCNEKGLEPRLTRTSMLKCTNDLQQQQQEEQAASDERNAKLQADTNRDSNHNCNEADSLGQQDIVQRGADMPLVGGQNTVMAANAPSVVNELWTDPPVKTQSKSFAFACPTRTSSSASGARIAS
ncbi:uncharacterized protein LOC133838289 [Drosophila sulfurigaster albostrigata]|uniref:uncharacterized protein LOC133838289 n=1 Tax=Drosophila sulfurigaster albostrigata TaxID=89887 RepID=UPI002D21928E|nr:uncharacterized protein LOC133838289 [Drosophila sulfurigaster albostrigata]